jgi:hypothetical protein
MAASLAFCPHCGASQDEQSRAESARAQWEIWLAILPALLGIITGWLLFQTVWASVVGLLVGVSVGVGLLAVSYARWHKK